MKIAVIPARGGSKRLPRKNVRSFCGLPMIARAIRTAQQSELFEHIVVSTEDAEIADIARAAGAEVPFVRPADLADDLTATVPVISHAVRKCQARGWAISHVCCIYPCVPLLGTADLAQALALFEETGADFVYPVSEYPHPVQRAMRRLPSGRMQFLNPENELSRTQDLEQVFHDAGQFYWGRTEAWLSGKRMHSAGRGYPIPHWRVVDIDTEDDWRRAELIFAALKPA